MKKILNIFLATLLLSTLSCNKKESREPAKPTVVLEMGTGALLIVFPHRSEGFNRDEWMSQVNLSGGPNSLSLPRIPLADLEAVMILNIEPGKYDVFAHSWIRKQEQSPQFGGSYEQIEILPAQMAVLKAKPLSSEKYPYSNVKMSYERSVGWSVTTPDVLMDFVAGVVKMGTKG